MRRLPVDDSVWSALRVAWAGSEPIQVETPEGGGWSPQELAVCASILGSPTFPTVTPDVLASLSEVELNATLDTVVYSFMARGLFRTVDGCVSLSEDLASVMEVAVFPDLTIAVECARTGCVELCWFCVRPDRAVRIAALSDGSRVCSAVDPSHVIGQVLGHSGIGRAGRGAPAAELESRSLDDVFGVTDEISCVARATTTWRVGGTVRGGVLAWAVAADGSVWSAEPAQTADDGSGSWELHASELARLRDDLLAHLPG